MRNPEHVQPTLILGCGSTSPLKRLRRQRVRGIATRTVPCAVGRSGAAGCYPTRTSTCAHQQHQPALTAAWRPKLSLSRQREAFPSNLRLPLPVSPVATLSAWKLPEKLYQNMKGKNCQIVTMFTD